MSQPDNAAKALGPGSALDDSVLEQPALALANVTREVVGICGHVETLLNTVIDLYETPDNALMQAVAELDERIDASHHEIKLYLARLAARDPDTATSLRMQELLAACIALEQAGDVASGNLLARQAHP